MDDRRGRACCCTSSASVCSAGNCTAEVSQAAPNALHTALCVSHEQGVVTKVCSKASFFCSPTEAGLVGSVLETCRSSSLRGLLWSVLGLSTPMFSD